MSDKSTPQRRSPKRKSRALPGPRAEFAAIAGEKWLPVVGYEGLYSVSDLGRVRSEPRIVMRKNGLQQTVHALILRTPPNKCGTGYMECGLNKAGVLKVRLVHQLVLEAFVGPRPAGKVGCHNDGDSRNSSAANLRWDTMKANGEDSVKHGALPRGENKPNAVLTDSDVLAIRADTRMQKEIAAVYGVDKSHISRIKSRAVWNHI